jgi:hypothetical protein
MPDTDLALRLRFADWIRARLPEAALTADEVGELIGRPPGWLVRFASNRRANRDLTLEEASRIVSLLGGDPDTVFKQLARDVDDYRT